MTELAARVTRALEPDADHVTLREQAGVALRRALGYDLAVWATVDPATVMWTSCVLDGAARDEQLEADVFGNEYGADDVLKLADLATGDLVGSLHRATDGDPMSSARYRDIFRPRGVSDELRVVFHDGTTTWGALNLLRTDRVFTAAELSSVRDLARPFGLALRAALLRARVDEAAGADPPVDPATFALGTAGAGLVLCGPDGRVLDLSDDARALLGPDHVPQAVHALVARTRSRPKGESSATAVNVGGRWLTLQATSLPGATAVVVEQIRPGQMADLIVRSRGLTGRERDVLHQIVLGRANKQIARDLRISEYTVADHVKALFVKFEVSSRTELVAKVFFDHYVPLHAGALQRP